MKLFMKRPGQAAWQGYAEPLLGLAEATEDVCDLVFAVEWPILEVAPVTGAVRLARRLLDPGVSIGIATPHPAGEWLSAAFEAGADSLMMAPDSPRYALGDCCPALHQRVRQNEPLSVCGRHRDRMVLAAHHLDRWCLGNHASCPHWRSRDEGAR